MIPRQHFLASNAPCRKLFSSLRLSVGLMAATLLHGCALTGNNFPSASNWGKAAVTAAEDPYTWAPLLGAAAVSVKKDWDEDISDWARDNNPVFGSSNTAESVSNWLIYGVAMPAAAASSFANARKSSKTCTRDEKSPDRCSGNDDFSSHYRDVSYDLAAFLAASGTTSVLKKAVGRTRPNGDDDKSFPSGHATGAFSSAYIFRHNMRSLYKEKALLWDVASVATASTIAWARVEAGKHYPRDILAGAALGNFMTAWVNNAYENKGSPDRRNPPKVTIIPDIRRDGLVMNVGWSM